MSVTVRYSGRVKTNAVLFVQPGKVILDEVFLPDPTPRDIVIQTEVSGISVGTERWAYLGKRGEIQFPNVPGYMGVGKIVTSGKEAQERGWREGERAYFFASRFSGELEGKSWMGSHVAHAVVDVCGPRAGGGELGIHHCEKVPANLAPEDAALAGLCGVAMRGIEMAVVPVGAKVLISGLGVIGQFALQVCQLKGAHVTVTDIVDARLEVAKALGAENIVHGKRDNLQERAKAIAPEGFDIIIDTSSVTAVVNSLFPLLKMRGKFVFQGWYPPPTPLDLNAMHMRMPSAYFPCAHSAEAVETALDWAARGWLRTKPLVTHTYAPKNAAEAYAMIEKGSENFLGILFDWRS
jgi:3-hydroxyethyl bacteriochlorophyllide a dehydrogenase